MMIRGERVYLAPLESTSLETVVKWVNDPEINQWLLTGHIPLTIEQERRWFDHVDRSTSDHVFEIHLAESGLLIGVCGLKDVDLIHGHAEIGITIGVAEEQGKGYGAEAIKTICRVGFHTLGLHTLGINFIEGNERSAALYQKLGFTHAGRLREYVFLRGRFRDLVLLDMTRAEFDERYGADPEEA